MFNLRVCLFGAAVLVACVSADLVTPPVFVTSSPVKAIINVTDSPVDKDLHQRQIEDTSSTDFMDEMLNLFVQYVSFDKPASSSGADESKLVENASQARGVIRLKKFMLPFLLGISVKTKALILAAIGFLLVLGKITFIKSKIALVIGVGLLLYHLYVKKHAIHHIKHALHQPHYDVSPAWSAPIATWAYPDWGAAAASVGHVGLGAAAPAAPYSPYVLRKTSDGHPTRFRR